MLRENIPVPYFWWSQHLVLGKNTKPERNVLIYIIIHCVRVKWVWQHWGVCYESSLLSTCWFILLNNTHSLLRNTNLSSTSSTLLFQTSFHSSLDTICNLLPLHTVFSLVLSADCAKHFLLKAAGLFSPIEEELHCCHGIVDIQCVHDQKNRNQSDTQYFQSVVEPSQYIRVHSAWY